MAKEVLLSNLNDNEELWKRHDNVCPQLIQPKFANSRASHSHPNFWVLVQTKPQSPWTWALLLSRNKLRVALSFCIKRSWGFWCQSNP